MQAYNTYTYIEMQLHRSCMHIHIAIANIGMYSDIRRSHEQSTEHLAMHTCMHAVHGASL